MISTFTMVYLRSVLLFKKKKASHMFPCIAHTVTTKYHNLGWCLIHLKLRDSCIQAEYQDQKLLFQLLDQTLERLFSSFV